MEIPDRYDVCKACGQIRPLSELHKRTGVCRACRGELKMTKAKMKIPAWYKWCDECGDILPLKAFHKDCCATDGRQHKCKVCQRAVVYARRKDNPEVAAMERGYMETWAEKNPEKALAHAAVHRAVRKGILVPEPCRACGSFERIHAHHESYAKDDWLKVIWPECIQ